MSAPAIEAVGVSKKFCRSLRRSLIYGVQDLGSDLLGLGRDRGRLRHNEFWALRDLSFELQQGETLGLIGPNGAGKTTLLRMMNGLINLDEGRMTVRGRLQALIALGAGFNPVLTGRENIFINGAILGISQSELQCRLPDIIDFAGIPEFLDSPVRSYSSGMIVRLGFAVAAFLEPDVLLVDEVLAVGDEGFQVKCLNKIGELKARGTAIVLVSHNMHTVSTYSDRILLMKPSGHALHEDVAEGVQAYRRLVHDGVASSIEKHCSGGTHIRFDEVEIGSQDLGLGHDFSLRLHYHADRDHPDIEVDTALRLAGQQSWHFQATNRTFDRRIGLDKGSGWLEITIEDLRVLETDGLVAVSVWARERSELLFWWRIPVRFVARRATSGTSLYSMRFTIEREALPAHTGPVIGED